MSFEEKLQQNLSDWYQNKDLDYKSFLKTIVSEEDAEKIVKAHQILSTEKEALERAKENGTSTTQWLYSKLNQRMDTDEEINSMDLEDYAGHLVHSQTKPLMDSFIPQFEEVEFDTEKVPELQNFFDAPLDSKEDAAVHNIAGATLYQCSKEENQSLDHTQAALLATNGIHTTKLLYQAGTQQITRTDAQAGLENQAIASLATIITTTAPKTGERLGEAIGAAIGSYFQAAPIGARIGKTVGRMAGNFIAHKAKPIAKTIVKSVIGVTKKAASFLKRIWG